MRSLLAFLLAVLGVLLLRLVLLFAWEALWACVIVPPPFPVRRDEAELSALDSSSSKDCALCFFGLAKHFKGTVLPSIRQHIMRTNPGCDVFVHTYNLSTTSNPRNGEIDSVLHVEEVSALEAAQHTFDSEADFRAAHDVGRYLPHFPTDVGWTFPLSMVNMIKQWHSIERVFESMEQHAVQTRSEPYERVGMFRIDVKYESPIRLHRGGDAVVPSFGDLRPGWMNDRMFYGSLANARIWSTARFSSVEGYTASRPSLGLHSERFVAYLMAASGIQVDERDDICFRRVRATGQVRTDDCGQPSCGYVMQRWRFSIGLLVGACVALCCAAVCWSLMPRRWRNWRRWRKKRYFTPLGGESYHP